MTENDIDQSQGWTTEKATPTDVFFHKLGEEQFRRNIPFLNEVLRQLLTTSIALMGGSIVFLTEPYCDKWIKLTASVLFFLAMFFAFVGVLPKRDFVRRSIPYEIKTSIERAVQWKYGFVCGASVFIMLGMLLAFVGVLIK